MAYLAAGPNGGALQATAGNNLLAGGAGFLAGGSGGAGGHDTFVIDLHAGVTWNTIVDLHTGDQIEVEGFQSGTSTMPFTEPDGVAGYTGATVHSELGGAGTGVNPSLTFAGIDVATARQHFAYASGTSPNASPYLLITYA